LLKSYKKYADGSINQKSFSVFPDGFQLNSIRVFLVAIPPFAPPELCVAYRSYDLDIWWLSGPHSSIHHSIFGPIPFPYNEIYTKIARLPPFLGIAKISSLFSLLFSLPDVVFCIDSPTSALPRAGSCIGPGIQETFIPGPTPDPLDLLQFFAVEVVAQLALAAWWTFWARVG
jgi:hypothetical protein